MINNTSIEDLDIRFQLKMRYVPISYFVIEIVDCKSGLSEIVYQGTIQSVTEHKYDVMTRTIERNDQFKLVEYEETGRVSKLSEYKAVKPIFQPEELK